MEPFDFTFIARRYERDAEVQRGAAEILLDLLSIRSPEDVLDLGCGTGHFTARLREITSGRVEGIDPASGMVEAARARFPAIPYRLGAAEDLAYRDEFDVVFCNSAMQWFRDPAGALACCRRALRKGGRIGVQAPATSQYCPQFVSAMEAVARHPATRDTFARFRSPWFFLESAQAYAEVFERAGFAVRFSRIDEVPSTQDPDGALRVFESGAVAGYLGPRCYDAPVTETYANDVRDIVKDWFREQAGAEGRLTLQFRRVFLVAVI